MWFDLIWFLSDSSVVLVLGLLAVSRQHSGNSRATKARKAVADKKIPLKWQDRVESARLNSTGSWVGMSWVELSRAMRTGRLLFQSQEQLSNASVMLISAVYCLKWLRIRRSLQQELNGFVRVFFADSSGKSFEAVNSCGWFDVIRSLFTYLEYMTFVLRVPRLEIKLKF